LFLKVEVIKKIIGIGAIALGFPFGVMGLVISLTAVSFLFTAINMLYCGKLIAYTLWSQVKDISGLFFIGITTFLACYLVHIYLLRNFTTNITIIGVVCLLFGITYFLLIWFFERGLVNQLKLIINR